MLRNVFMVIYVEVYNMRVFIFVMIGFFVFVVLVVFYLFLKSEVLSGVMLSLMWNIGGVVLYFVNEKEFLDFSL